METQPSTDLVLRLTPVEALAGIYAILNFRNDGTGERERLVMMRRLDIALDSAGARNPPKGGPVPTTPLAVQLPPAAADAGLLALDHANVPREFGGWMPAAQAAMAQKVRRLAQIRAAPRRGRS